ncbi:MAG: M50 family metallopeptidase [Patescibacteria group bacterium]
MPAISIPENIPDINPFWYLLVSIPFMAMAIDFLLSHSIFGYRYRLFVAPGIIIHEVAHAVACLVTGAKIKALDMFNKNGGSVEHFKPKLPIIGPILISTAPIIFGVIIIYFLSKLIGLKPVDLTGMNYSYSDGLELIKRIILSFNAHGIRNGIVLYLLFSVAVTMNPSIQDLKNIFLSLLIIGVGILATFRYTSLRPSISQFNPTEMTIVLSTVVALLILCLILSIIIFTLSKFIKPK